MNLAEFDYQILRLSDFFYETYPADEYEEIEGKEQRPYNCLLIQSKYDYYICVPFRSNVKHGNAYHFSSSKRSKRCKSALDYSKIIIVNNTKYLAEPIGIDDDEYVEMVGNIKHIVKQVHKYIDEYVLFASGEKDVNNRTFERKYKFTTLKYFHKELGIT